MIGVETIFLRKGAGDREIPGGEGELVAEVKKDRKMTTIKSQLAALCQPWMGFACFVRLHAALAAGIAAVLALVYGIGVFSNYFYIDKEMLVNNPGSFYNWSEIGRFGLILMKKALGMSWYNPYLAGVMLMITLWMVAMASGYLFKSIDHRLTASSLGIFMLLFCVYPTYVEQFLFQFQAFEVVLAMLFLLVSDWYLVVALREKNGMAFLASVPLAVIAFGTYQSMAPLQLCLYLGISLMYVYAEEGKKKTIAASAKLSVIHFLLTFGSYELISKLFFAGSDYLSGQIIWRTEGYKTAFLSIGNYIVDVVKMREVCYTLTYDLCWMTGLAALVVLFIRYRRRAVWYGLGLLGVVLSPFFLTFVTGAGQSYRAQMTLPLACGVLWLFGTHVISGEPGGGRKESARILLLLAGGVMVFLNIAPIMRLYYTRDVIGKADEMTAVMIVDKLSELPSAYEGKPVIFIGHRPPMINNACYESCSEWYRCNTYTVFSVFEMDYIFEPYYFFSTYRILGFFETLGFREFQGPSDGEIMPLACRDSEDMPSWPLEGSVREFNDYIIVKLSQAEY